MYVGLWRCMAWCLPSFTDVLKASFAHYGLWAHWTDRSRKLHIYWQWSMTTHFVHRQHSSILSLSLSAVPRKSMERVDLYWIAQFHTTVNSHRVWAFELCILSIPVGHKRRGMKKGKIEERGKNDESKAHKTALYAKIQKKNRTGCGLKATSLYWW